MMFCGFMLAVNDSAIMSSGEHACNVPQCRESRCEDFEIRE
jgi:hypothetical protein